MKLIQDRFCGLSRAKDFQAFLRGLSPSLYQSLINHLQLNEGCKSNSVKMREIYSAIKESGDENKLLDFMLERYPHMVIRGKEDKTKKEDKQQQKKVKVKQITAATSDQLYGKLNYHKVFEVYKPKVLFVPQRRIFVGPNKNHVTKSINSFVSNKLDVDYIVLEGPELWHGYVEYFEPRFRDQIKLINHSQRPIARYRRLHMTS